MKRETPPIYTKITVEKKSYHYQYGKKKKENEAERERERERERVVWDKLIVYHMSVYVRIVVKNAKESETVFDLLYTITLNQRRDNTTFSLMY